MVADVPGIGALDHRNACVVIDRDDADRHAGEQLAHDTRMPEGVDRYLTPIETGRRDLLLSPPPYPTVLLCAAAGYPHCGRWCPQYRRCHQLFSRKLGILCE